MILFELSGEDRNLATLEISSLLETYGCRWKTQREHRAALVIEGENSILASLARRLGYTRRIARVSREIKISTIPPQSLALDIDLGGKRFAIRTKKVDPISYSGEKIIDALGDYLLRHNPGSRVDLNHPEIRIDLFLAGEFVYIASEVFEVNRKKIDSRMPKLRPIQTPVGMHPRLARAMVNLAHVREGDVVVDPFCGTGGVLLESAEMGMHAVGIDIQERMVVASRKNLAHYGLKGTVIHGDAAEMSSHLMSAGITRVDAIVSDLPYGRSSTLAGRELKELVAGFIFQAEETLRKGKFMVICINDEELLKTEVADTKFSIVNEFRQRVHKSLTRYFFVLQKN